MKFAIIYFIILVYVITTFLWLLLIKHRTADELINPIDIYEDHKVNVFGCLLLTLIRNLVFLPVALCYWLYKLVYTLCTIGRK